MPRLFHTLIAATGLAAPFVSSRQYAQGPANSSSQSTEGATSSWTTPNGPFLAQNVYYWVQHIYPVTVGTVMVTVNEMSNETSSTTIYHSDYQKNGSLMLLTRTDTNAAGTVTQAVTVNGTLTTFTYPTNYVYPDDEMTWIAKFPVTATGVHYYFSGDIAVVTFNVTSIGHDGTCCLDSNTHSATPIHTPFKQSGTANAEDPQGWLYTISTDPDTQLLQPSEVSALWSPQSLDLTYSGCYFTDCLGTEKATLPEYAEAAEQAGILATSTTTLSSDTLSTVASAAAKSAATEPLAPSSLIKDRDSSPSDTTPAAEPSPTGRAADAAQLAPDAVVSTALSPLSDNALPQPQPLPTITPQPARQSPDSDTQPTTSQSPIAQNTALSHLPVIVIGSTSVTKESDSVYIVYGQTLAPGISITIGSDSGTTVVALRTSGSETVVQVGTDLSTMPSIPKATDPTPTQIEIAGITLAPGSSSDYVVSGQTLAPGSSITLGSGSSTTIIAILTGNSQSIVVAGSVSTTLEPNVSPLSTSRGIGASSSASLSLAKAQAFPSVQAVAGLFGLLYIALL